MCLEAPFCKLDPHHLQVVPWLWSKAHLKMAQTMVFLIFLTNDMDQQKPIRWLEQHKVPLLLYIPHHLYFKILLDIPKIWLQVPHKVLMEHLKVPIRDITLKTQGTMGLWAPRFLTHMLGVVLWDLPL